MKRPDPWWLVVVLASAAAVGRVLTARNSDKSWRADESTRVAMFREIAATESAVRSDAERAFPGDPWSADDDFHRHEQQLAYEAAARHRATVPDALRAIDEGLREHWSHSNPEPLIATVPPCHPRPLY